MQKRMVLSKWYIWVRTRNALEEQIRDAEKLMQYYDRQQAELMSARDRLGAVISEVAAAGATLTPLLPDTSMLLHPMPSGDEAIAALSKHYVVDVATLLQSTARDRSTAPHVLSTVRGMQVLTECELSFISCQREKLERTIVHMTQDRRGDAPVAVAREAASAFQPADHFDVDDAEETQLLYDNSDVGDVGECSSDDEEAPVLYA